MTNTPLDKSNTLHVKRVTVIDEGRDPWEVRGRLLMFLFVLRGTFFKGGAVNNVIIGISPRERAHTTSTL